MSQPLSEENRIQEQIRVSYLRHRGNLFAVQEELKIPKDYILRVVSKFKREDKRNLPNFVAEKVLEHLMLGYNSRVQHLMETIAKIESEEKQKRSTCCSGRIRLMDTVAQNMPGIEAYECLKCKKLCDVYDYIAGDALSLKITTLNQLAKEDELLFKFLTGMGYVGEKSVPQDSTPAVVFEDNSKHVHISPEEVKELSKLGPLELEALRLKIEKKLDGAEIIDVETKP